VPGNKNFKQLSIFTRHEKIWFLFLVREKTKKELLAMYSVKVLTYLVKVNPKTPSAKSVSKKTLRSVWERISHKPFPDVYAFTLEDSEFLSTLALLQKQKKVIDTRVKEYGAKIDNHFIEACTFKFKGHFVIFVKQTVPLVGALEHELRHVASWNFKDESP